MAALTPIYAQNGIGESLAQLTKEVRGIAADAGKICMRYYNAAATDDSVLQTELKADNSPVTAADKASSEYIVGALTKLTPGIAVVSEENDVCPSPDEIYWTADPLDGTKLFTNRTGGFAVNIALMVNRSPVLGVVACPAHGIMYYAYEGSNAFKQEGTCNPKQIKTRKIYEKGDLKAYFDIAHAKAETYKRARELMRSRDVTLPLPDTTRILPQNLMIAEGQFDMHIKTGKDITFRACSGRSWDNAADYRILTEAGGTMAYLVQGGIDDHPEYGIHLKPMTFDLVRDRMPGYITIGDRNWAEANFAELRR